MKPTHLVMTAAAMALAAGPALAQAQRAPARGAPPAAAPAPAGPPPVYPCRTAQEVCHLGIVVGSQVAVLFSSAPDAQPDDKPVDVTGKDGAKIDMAKDAGRVVMLTGTWDPKAGIRDAEVVEVASPLASLVVKAQLGGGPDAAAPQKPAARRR